MKPNPLVLAALGVVLASGTGYAQSDTHGEPGGSSLVTLDEVMELARSRSPLVDVAQAELDELSFRRLEAELARLPSVSANLTAAPAPAEVGETDSELDQFGSIFEGTSYAMRGSLSATLPIYTFGKIRLARQLAAVGMDAQEALLQQAELEAMFEAYRAYTVLQWHEEVDALLDEAAGRLDEAEETLEIALDDGDRSARTSLRQLTIYRAEFVETRTEADAAERLARYALSHALNLPEDFGVETLDEAIGAAPVDEEDALDFALTHRADYQLLDANVEAARIQAARTRADTLPDFFGVFGMSGRRAPSYEDRTGPFVYDPYNSFTLGFAVGARWSFDLGRDVARMMFREAQIVTAEQEREGGRLLIELDVIEAYTDATSAYAVLEAQSEARRAATAWLNQVAFQYDQGLADFEEFVAPLRTYYDTSSDYYEALLGYRLALANLALQTGAETLDTWPGLEPTE